MIVALLPAGGQSRRMGQPKLLLPLGRRTILEHVIAAIRKAGIERILVVANGQVPELAAVARSAGAAVLTLPHETPDMRATVEFGLKWIEQTWSPGPEDCWLLVPADHPAIEAGVIRELLAAESAHPEVSIFMPKYDGRRGHPTLIRWPHVSGIRHHPAGEGLNRYFRLQADQVCEMPVSNPGVLIDIDTPEDYQHAIRSASPQSHPS
jgi:CTP:molybdopterin cytidylyltransferase MocA